MVRKFNYKDVMCAPSSSGRVPAIFVTGVDSSPDNSTPSIMATRVRASVFVISLWFLTLSHMTIAARNLLQSCTTTYPPQYIIAPSYVYPCSLTDTSCAWYRFSNGADVVILNPDSGPGTTKNPDFVTLVNSIRASTDTYITTIIGYVATTYGAKSTAQVQKEIALYNKFYKVDGIFLDEADTSCSKASYYSNIVNFVQLNTSSPTGQDYTVMNWGTDGFECQATTSPSADTFVTFENNASRYASYSPSSWMSNYSPDRFCHIVYDVSQAQVSNTVALSKQRRAGRVYVTNYTGANPYDAAPSADYWAVEVDKAAAPC